MRTVINSTLFMVGNSLKVNMRLNTRLINEPNTQDTITKNIWNGNEYIKLSLNPYLEFDFRNNFDFKNEDNKKSAQLKVLAISRRDVFALICKLKDLIKNLYNDNELFYLDSNKELKLNSDKSELFTINHNTIYGDKLSFKPVVLKLTDNKSYEGVAIILRDDISLYTLMTTEELRYFVYELEHLNFSLLAHELFNVYIKLRDRKSVV